MKTKTATLVFCLIASGCAQINNSARINPQSVAVYPGSKGHDANQSCPLTSGVYDTRVGAIDLDCFTLPGGQATAYIAAADDEIVRNRLSAVLLTHADNVCVVEKGRLIARSSGVNFSLSLATTALAAASTIVGGEQAKTILSGLATTASGTRDNVNATFYRNQITQAITKAIDTERQEIRTQIEGKRTLSKEQWTVDEMIRLVNAYHQACSFEHGLQALLDASVDASGAQAVVQNQARSAAISRLEQHLAYLQKNAAIAGAPDQIKDTLAKIHALQVADATAREQRADAADATKEK